LRTSREAAFDLSGKFIEIPIGRGRDGFVSRTVRPIDSNYFSISGEEVGYIYANL